MPVDMVMDVDTYRYDGRYVTTSYRRCIDTMTDTYRHRIDGVSIRCRYAKIHSRCDGYECRYASIRIGTMSIRINTMTDTYRYASGLHPMNIPQHISHSAYRKHIDMMYCTVRSYLSDTRSIHLRNVSTMHRCVPVMYRRFRCYTECVSIV